MAPPEFLRSLRALCDKHGILLIADEIRTGFARTGRRFAIEHAGVEPDLMTVAKSIAGGVPLSAVIGKAEIMDAPVVGGLGGTFAGSPLACAAGLAVLEVLEKEKLNQRAIDVGAKLVSRLKQMQAKFHCIGVVRALGMMVAIELVKNRRADLPDAELTRAVVQAAGRRGLVLLSCGLYSNVIRILAPLTIGEALLEEGLDLLEQALAEASAGTTTAVA
jgi:4-aminobutyrate aminotransferase/(S)-3-amino-2-methylpropionate transaminase